MFAAWVWNEGSQLAGRWIGFGVEDDDLLSSHSWCSFS